MNRLIVIVLALLSLLVVSCQQSDSAYTYSSQKKQSLSQLPKRSLEKLLPPLGQRPAEIPSRVTLLHQPLPAQQLQKQFATISPRTTHQRKHFVQSGDTLYSIAKYYYGRGNQWDVIAQANHTIIHNPADLKIGMQIIIP